MMKKAENLAISLVEAKNNVEGRAIRRKAVVNTFSQHHGFQLSRSIRAERLRSNTKAESAAVRYRQG
jgi:hypothetical protein